MHRYLSHFLFDVFESILLFNSEEIKWSNSPSSETTASIDFIPKQSTRKTSLKFTISAKVTLPSQSQKNHAGKTWKIKDIKTLENPQIKSATAQIKKASASITQKTLPKLCPNLMLRMLNSWGKAAQRQRASKQSSKGRPPCLVDEINPHRSIQSRLVLGEWKICYCF